MIGRLRAPQADGGVLCEPPRAAWTDLVRHSVAMQTETTKREHRREFLNAARAYHRHLGEPISEADPDAPLLMGGHQPELFHPGVWAKNFALAGLARQVRGTVVNLIVDQDLLKTPTLKIPVFGTPVRSETIAYDAVAPVQPYELRRLADAHQFAHFPARVKHLSADWPFTPLLHSCWPASDATEAVTLGERFAAMRRRAERRWGVANLELPVSRLAKLRSFAEFVAAVERRLPEFRAIYNAAIRGYRNRRRLRSQDHPAPELAEGERPFWRITASGRERPMQSFPAHELRPRALTLTLFVRRMLADFFLHGLGGGLYDEVTDEIAVNFFGCALPPYGVFTLTSRLPLPGNRTTPAHLAAAVRRERDKVWNPQRFFPPFAPERQAFDDVLRADQSTKQARRERYRRLREMKGMLRPDAEDAGIERLRADVAANEILQRREYAWVLYPEAFLQPRLTALSGDG